MSEENKDVKTPTSDDKELSELLDSALEDFNATKTEKKTEDGQTVETAPTDMLGGEGVWSEEFLRQAAQQFESQMAGLLGGANNTEGLNINPGDLTQNFQRMAEAAALALNPENLANMPPVDPDFASTIAQTLQGLNSGADNLQAPFNPDDLMSMFGNLDMGEGGVDGGNALLPFMQGMMQSLLSAEVLLPSMKDLLSKYPEWIEANKDTCPADDLERYKQQQELISSVCAELEGEQESDSAEVKKQRFDKVLELMQKMQDLGQPPTELVGADLGLMQMPMGAPGLGGPPVDPSQCSIM